MTGTFITGYNPDTDTVEASYGDPWKQRHYGYEPVTGDVLYARAIQRWRSPVLHLAFAYKSIAKYPSWHPSKALSYFAFWHCDRSFPHDAKLMSSVPDGFEICQRCAETVAADRRRDNEIETPDRARFRTRTAELLAEAHGVPPVVTEG